MAEGKYSKEQKKKGDEVSYQWEKNHFLRKCFRWRKNRIRKVLEKDGELDTWLKLRLLGDYMGLLKRD